MRGLPRISIVIPSYNKVDYIGETLQSIVDQDYKNMEVIIQDPGSTDGSLEIISSYVKKYPKIFKLYKEEDNGQLDAINIGLKKAKGDILTYINADDVYEPGAFDIVAKYFSDEPKTLWVAGMGRVINGEGVEIAKSVTTYKNLLLLTNIYPLLLITNYLIQPSVFLSKTAWEKYGPFRGKTKFIMEYEMWLRIGKKKVPSVIRRYLSSFRMSDDNISATQFESTLKEDERIVKKHTNSKLILALHKLHNEGRKMIIKKI